MTITVHRETAFDTATCYMPVTFGGVRHLTYLPPALPYTGTPVEFVCELVRIVGTQTRHEPLFDCNLCAVMYKPHPR
jgi:hypothetical protein